MIQICQNLAFGIEPQQHRAALPCGRVHELDRDFLAVRLVGPGSEIDPSHASFADRPHQPVWPDPRTVQQRLFLLSSRNFHDRVPGESESLARRRQQRFDFPQHIGITTALLQEKPGTFALS